MSAPARTRLIAGTIAALTVATVLTGCSNQSTDPNAWKSDVPTATATPTPTPTVTPYKPVSKPGTVSPPKSDTEAWQGASAAVKDFIAVQYEIQHNTGRDPNRIDPYATPAMRDYVHAVAKQLKDQKVTVTGAPKWTPNAAASSYGALIKKDGTQIENGTVYVVGCWDLTSQVSKKADGSVVPASKQRVGPMQFKTQYIPDAKAWEVAEAQLLTGSGAPQC